MSLGGMIRQFDSKSGKWPIQEMQCFEVRVYERQIGHIDMNHKDKSADLSGTL